MAQSPTISIPKKSTDEVDWTTPIKAIIRASYGENPENYAAECAALQRCRQDAVRGAGSDLTAASLLTKYFGQLELLELRFSEIRVSFPWRDAFTSKLTTQTSLAFEKASIIYQIAAFHSSIASAQNRSSPEGLKRAYYYFRTCAGMLGYINDNFLHAPSTDLSREVVKFLVGIMMAQANECFYETCIDQRKAVGLVSKVAANAAYLYSNLCEEVKEFMGKGIFDRNWVTVLQIKSRYFTSVMQYQRSLADTAAGKHGEALSRMAVAESNAKEAHRLASSFSPYFVSTSSTTLPADSGTSILELTKNHLAICTEKHTQGQKDNDLIYNAVVPAEATLPVVDKISAVTPIPIQEVYGTPEVQKTIGPDLFGRLIPLSVHEGASVYSEEKAKLVRKEVEKSEMADGEVKAALESLGVKEGVVRFKEIAEGVVDENVPSVVVGWQEEIRRREASKDGANAVERLLKDLETLKVGVQTKLNTIQESMDMEARQCEMERVKYAHKWTMDPSSGLNKDLRRDWKEMKSSLDAAAPSDQQVFTLWSGIREDVAILMDKKRLEATYASAVHGTGGSLLDVSDTDTDDAEREKMGKLVGEIEERLGRLNKIARERNEILKDLKERIQNDDVSHLLLLNRRTAGPQPNGSGSSNVEATIFANELEKFRPYQSRIASTIHAQTSTINEIGGLWKSLKNLGGGGKGKGNSKKNWEEREKRVKEVVRRMAAAREGYLEVTDGVMKGLQFYKDLTKLTNGLNDRVETFVSSRIKQREALAGKLAVEARLEGAASPPTTLPSHQSSGSISGSAPIVPPPPPRPLESAFSSMSLGGSGGAQSGPSVSSPTGMGMPPPMNLASPHTTGSLPPPQISGYSSISPQPYSHQPQQQQHQPQQLPPPPPLQQYQSQYSTSPPQQQQQPQQQYPYQSPYSSPPQQQQPQQQQQYNPQQQLPPPPPQRQQTDPYAGMFGSMGLSSQFSLGGSGTAAPSHTPANSLSTPPVQSPVPSSSSSSPFGHPTGTPGAVSTSAWTTPGPPPSFTQPPQPQQQQQYTQSMSPPPSNPYGMGGGTPVGGPQHHLYQGYQPSPSFTPQQQPQPQPSSPYGQPQVAQPMGGGYGYGGPGPLPQQAQQPQQQQQQQQQQIGLYGLPPPPSQPASSYQYR
ncbi:BRO1-domain-containing protein [Serendipita vermifera]|nr:BRO1-domain-containing protein [Serendipita vermifera]